MLLISRSRRVASASLIRFGIEHLPRPTILQRMRMIAIVLRKASSQVVAVTNVIAAGRLTPQDVNVIRHADRLVGLGRVELPTSPLSGVRSSHLSYRPNSSRYV